MIDKNISPIMKCQAGTIQAINSAQINNPLHTNPIVQILNFSMIPASESDKPRCKMNISDGLHYMKAIGSADVCSLIGDNRLKALSIVRLDAFVLRNKDSLNYLYISKLSVVEGADAMIGNPVNIGVGKASYDIQNKSNSSYVQNPTTAQQVSNVASKTNSSTVKREVAPVTNDISKKFKTAFTDIKDLNPFQSAWVIKGRVSVKSDIKKFTNAKGEGKLFSFDISDATAEVRATCFSDTVDVIFPLVRVGKVYTITNGQIKMANKKYTTSNFDYELTLDKTTEIQEMTEDADIPMYRFNFVQVSELKNAQSLVDVIGVIHEVFPIGNVVVKSTGKDLAKRDVLLIDQTGSVMTTFWGSKAQGEYTVGEVLCLKGAKTSDYNGVSLSTLANTQLIQDSELPEAIELISWYQTVGVNTEIVRPQRARKRCLIGDVKDSTLEYATFAASILAIREDNIYYAACPTEGCNKKVTEEDSNCYRCEKCNYTFDKCNYRYIMSACVGDVTDQIWVSIYDQQGMTILGKSAAEFADISKTNLQDMRSIIHSALSQEFIFNIRIKDNEYNGEMRKRYSVSSIDSIDIVAETKRMLEAISLVNV